jgi:hypothetical protein
MAYGNKVIKTHVLRGKINVGSKGTVDLKEKEIKENGIYVAENEGYDGYSSVNVNVQPNLQQKAINPTTEVQMVGFDDGYDGLKNVTIGAIQTETKHIQENGTYTPEDGKFFSEVTVNILDVSYQNVALLVLATRSATASDTNYTDSHGYSSEIGVENGEVVLLNPETITPNSLSAYKTYVGGYIEVSGAVYYLPEDAYIIEDTIKNNLNVISTYRVICTNAQKVVAGNVVYPVLQAKTVTPTSEVQEVTPDSGYYGLSKVTVGAAAGKELPIAEQATFGGGEADIPYEIQGATLTGIADQIQRIREIDEALTPEQMHANLCFVNPAQELPKAELYTFGKNESDIDYGITVSGAPSKAYSKTYGVSTSFTFTAVEPFAILGVRHMNPSSGDKLMRIWNESGDEVVSVSNADVASGDWVEVVFRAPLNIAAGETYQVGIMHASENRCFEMSQLTKVNAKINITARNMSYNTGKPSGSLFHHPCVDIIIGSISATPPSTYQVERLTMSNIADEVKRITGVQGSILPSEIITALKSVPVQTS